MPIWGNTAGGWKNIGYPFINVSGTWKPVIDAWNNVSGTWKRCFGGPLVITVSSGSAFGQYTGAGSGTATTSSVTAAALTGVGPFTYLWQYVSGDATTGANSGSAATTTFSRTATAPAGPFNAVWQCKVTDSTGHIGYSPTVTVTTLFT